MRWTINVSFTNGVNDWILATESKPFKPDRKFGSFRDPFLADTYLNEQGWECRRAMTRQGDYTPEGSYYRKSNMHAVITRLPTPEELTILKKLN